MKYQVVERNQKHVDAISKALKKAKALFLATDPDREGEAISWHLYEMLKDDGELKGKAVQRVVFYEITKDAVREAMAQPRELSLDLVNAQQARRALDYLVGFNLSPLLWKKVRRGLSAGRVQSPALRMICEREEEIAAFVAREYWTIDAELEHTGTALSRASWSSMRGAKVEQFSFTNEAQAREVERTLRRRRQRRASRCWASTASSAAAIPAPPFTTSTLQQEAARKLGFSAQKTMRVAQQLYEGVDIGEGAVGLITYMRTDSVNLAQEAVGADPRGDRAALRQGGAGGGTARSTRPSRRTRRKRTRRSARPPPASCRRTSRRYLEADQFRLYSLIWKRAVACQMAPAVFDTVAVDMLAGSRRRRRAHVLRANGSTLVKPGYIAVYQEGRDDAVQDDTDHVLPPMQEGDRVELIGVTSDAAFHRAAAALHRSLAGQGARGIRHRPPVDLRLDHLDAARSRIRGDREPALHRHRHRQDRQPLPDAAFHDRTSTTASPPRWRMRSMRSRAARRNGSRRWTSSGSRSSTRSSTPKRRHPRAGGAGTRTRHRSGQRQADERAHGPLRTVRADRHQGR